MIPGVFWRFSLEQTKHITNVDIPETKKGELESLGVFHKNLCVY